MRISDWSSDVCSSDLITLRRLVIGLAKVGKGIAHCIARGVRNGHGCRLALRLRAGHLPRRPDDEAGHIQPEGAGGVDQFVGGQSQPGMPDGRIDEDNEGSEERRVGKECVHKLRYRGWPANKKKKK